MMQVRLGRRMGEPVVGSGWDIFTMDAGSVWETEGGEVGFLVVLPIRQGV